MLTENVHYEHITIEPQRIVYVQGEPWGYCYDSWGGKAQVLRITHPDVDVDLLAGHGEHLRRLRLAKGKDLTPDSQTG